MNDDQNQKLLDEFIADMSELAKAYKTPKTAMIAASFKKNLLDLYHSASCAEQVVEAKTAMIRVLKFYDGQIGK